MPSRIRSNKKPADVARASRPLSRERPAPASGRGQDAGATAGETPALRDKARAKTDYTSPERLQKIFSALDELFPQAQCALRHENPFQLLVATILSAQCTDERVNKVTPGLFQKYPTPQDFAALSQPVLEEEIRSTGFFRNKAKNIIGTAKKLVADFGGKVPQDNGGNADPAGSGAKDSQRRVGDRLRHTHGRGRGHPRFPHRTSPQALNPEHSGESRAGSDQACPARTMDILWPPGNLVWKEGLPGAQASVRGVPARVHLRLT